MLEYRVSNNRIQQGHYLITLEDAIKEAKTLSKKFPSDLIIIELFKPKPRRIIGNYRNGEFLTHITN